MMVIMGAFPNARRAECKYSKDSHDDTRQTRFGQYRLMLLVVVNHEKPENQQPSENTANNLAREPEIAEGPRDGSHQQKSSGKDIPPTPGWVLHRIRSSGQYKFFTCSQCSLPILHPEGRRALCQKCFAGRRHVSMPIRTGNAIVDCR